MRFFNMKLLMSAFLIFCGLVIIQENKIKGKYEMQYEQKFKSQNFVVDFGSQTYKRKLPDGKIVKGVVRYSDNTVLLTDPAPARILSRGSSKYTIP